MRDICEKYAELLRQKKLIDEQLESLHDYLEATMKKYDMEEYDRTGVPVTVDRVVYTSERMRKGAKDRLRELLSEKEWAEIYRERQVVSYRVSLRE